jgi:hypothetical protein
MLILQHNKNITLNSSKMTRITSNINRSHIRFKSTCFNKGFDKTNLKLATKTHKKLLNFAQNKLCKNIDQNKLKSFVQTLFNDNTKKTFDLNKKYEQITTPITRIIEQKIEEKINTRETFLDDLSDPLAKETPMDSFCEVENISLIIEPL